MVYVTKRIVEIVVKEGPERISEIIEWGAKFDKDADGDYSLGKEGGHSVNRILHHKDVTGKEMERALIAKIQSLPNIEVNNSLLCCRYHYAASSWLSGYKIHSRY